MTDAQIGSWAREIIALQLDKYAHGDADVLALATSLRTCTSAEVPNVVAIAVDTVKRLWRKYPRKKPHMIIEAGCAIAGCLLPATRVGPLETAAPAAPVPPSSQILTCDAHADIDSVPITDVILHGKISHTDLELLKRANTEMPNRTVAAMITELIAELQARRDGTWFAKEPT